ncbi:hypothetical protein AVEN_181050-1 [Araneus ventricosus]|uniref:Reverse transcriptase/retrotransposon-derived protein RNase H-like domain-containing protein n=1 Tax=Araneus ventricosus TaxID=182803 RepID=A0A4Y2KM78_ARAVE|nr:hypothetical protein AVEN_181050-1 [Araneus ventricosus]
MLKFILQKREVSTPFKRFKPSQEVKPRVTGQANKFRRPAQNQENSGRKCQYCGSRRVPGRCPAYGKQCRSYRKQNNFSRACKSRSVNWVCQNNPGEFPIPIPQIAFGSDNEQIEKSPVLAFFDPKVESEIVVDASPFGLGAVLQEIGKPIAFASSTLTSTQRNYAHIEKELLAVVYGCKNIAPVCLWH